MRTVQSWTCELGYGADTMFHRTYFLFVYNPCKTAFVFNKELLTYLVTYLLTY